MKKLLMFTGLSLFLVGCSTGEKSKTKPNPLLDDTTKTVQIENNGNGSKSVTLTEEKSGGFDEVLKNVESYMNDGMNTTDDKYLEYKNIKYFKIKTDKEYLVLSGEQYIKDTQISSGLRAVKFFNYNSETGKVEKAVISGFPIQSLLIGDSSKAGAYNTALREKNPNIMPQAMKGKLVQNSEGEFAYIYESMSGEKYSLKIAENKVNLEKVDSYTPINEKSLISSDEKEVTWTPVSGKESSLETSKVESTTKSEESTTNPKVYINSKGEKLSLYADGRIIDEIGQDHNTKREVQNGRVVLVSDRVVGSVAGGVSPVLFFLEGDKLIKQPPNANSETYILEK